jgi:hypothetical protein
MMNGSPIRLDAVAGPGSADALGRESFDERGRGRREFRTFGLWQPAGARLDLHE